MVEIFNLDNPLWRFMGKVFDMMVLTVLWVLTSLPLFTIGASTTALYYVGMKLAKDQEGYVIKDFFHSFRENFRQATIMSLVLAGIGIFLITDLLWYYQFKSGAGVVALSIFSILTVLYVMILTYVFPLLARCQAGIRKIFLMAFMIAVKNFGWTVLMITIMLCLLAIGVFICAPFLFLAVGMCAYLQGKILYIVFKQYHFVLV